MLMTLLVAAAATFGFLAFVASRPDTFRVQRSTLIKAPPEAIFPLIEDFHRWPDWSPYEKLDPAMTRTYGGPASGKGAIYAWAGDKKAGVGRMEVLDAQPPSKVVIKLDFLKPFEGHNTAEFTLQPRGQATEVTWAMYGPVPFVAKAMHLVFSMDKLVGRAFESGLANLKAVTER